MSPTKALSQYECTECRHKMPTVPRPLKCEACGKAVGFIEVATEEPWEWDGDCTACHVGIVWEGDKPESAEEALCHDCYEDELRLKLETMKAERDALKLDFQAYVAWVADFEDLLEYSQRSIHDGHDNHECPTDPAERIARLETRVLNLEEELRELQLDVGRMRRGGEY